MKPKHSISKGDLVLVVNPDYFIEWNGTVARALTGLCRLNSRDLHTLHFEEFMGYRLKLSDGTIVCAKPHQIVPIREGDDAETARDTVRNFETLETSVC